MELPSLLLGPMSIHCKHGKENLACNYLIRTESDAILGSVCSIINLIVQSEHNV